MADNGQEQSAVEPTDDGTATSPSEESGAQDESLETLLQQWEESEAAESGDSDSDTKGGQTDKPGSTSTDTDTAELVRWAREERERSIAERAERDVNEAIETLKDGWDDPPPDRVLKGDLHRAAAEDPRFLQAFQQRHRNPEAWKRILKAQQRELRAEFESRPDREATDDRRAVESAVRSSSRAPQPAAEPSKEDWNKMSDAEFERRKREALGIE